MRELNFIEAVAERDIDLLLLEEMHVSPAFQQWFVEQALGPEINIEQFDGAWHSVTHPIFHESDLVFIFTSNGAKRVAILIENKIDALPQPDQAIRYGKRGEAGIADGFWHEYRTCIVAPQAYLRSEPEAEIYQSRISYEAIQQWFLSNGDTRSRYRARFIAEAIEQNRRGYQPIPHEHVTAFWQDYWAMVAKDFPQLPLKRRSNVPRDADWPEFRSPVLGRDRKILHKWARGAVDLQIDGAGGEAQKIAESYATLLEQEGMQVVETGKSASVRLVVPVVDRLEGFKAQEEAVRAGLKAAVRLLSFSSSIVWPLVKDTTI